MFGGISKWRIDRGSRYPRVIWICVTWFPGWFTRQWRIWFREFMINLDWLLKWTKLSFVSAKFTKEDGSRFEKEASNRWSMVTFRIALALYMRNKDSYKSLESFRILELPSLPPLQEYSLEVKNNPASHLVRPNLRIRNANIFSAEKEERCWFS